MAHSFHASVIFATGLVEWVPKMSAVTITGEAEWFLAGFLLGITFASLGQVVRFVRSAAAGSVSP